MTIYLYKKTHKVTGLNYLGKTTQNPFKYKGSGKYWKAHLAKHGCEVDTEILKECKDTDELKQWGLYYSNLWNIVESNQWANLKEEAGDGGTQSLETRAKMSEVKRGKKQSDDSKIKRSASLKGRTFSEESRLKMSMAAKKHAQDPNIRAKILAAKLGKKHSEETKAKISATIKAKRSR